MSFLSGSTGQRRNWENWQWCEEKSGKASSYCYSMDPFLTFSQVYWKHAGIMFENVLISFGFLEDFKRESSIKIEKSGWQALEWWRIRGECLCLQYCSDLNVLFYWHELWLFILIQFFFEQLIYIFYLSTCLTLIKWSDLLMVLLARYTLIFPFIFLIFDWHMIEWHLLKEIDVWPALLYMFLKYWPSFCFISNKFSIFIFIFDNENKFFIEWANWLFTSLAASVSWRLFFSFSIPIG